MTGFLHQHCPALSGTGQLDGKFLGVMPPVLPRRSLLLRSGRSGGSSRLRREGTDPASRGRKRRGGQPGGGSA